MIQIKDLEYTTLKEKSGCKIERSYRIQYHGEKRYYIGTPNGRIRLKH